MAHVVELPSFTLKEGVSEPEFLLAHEKFNQDFMARQKGYVSHSLLKDGDTWFDLAVWESREAMQDAFKDIYENDSASAYISLINPIGSDEEISVFSIVRRY